MNRKQYHAIRANLSAPERRLIEYYEVQWLLRGRVPTPEEVVNYLKAKYPSTNLISVNYYLQRAKVKQALQDRGIPYEENSRDELSATQIAAAATVMNFADGRSTKEKLHQLGISPSQYYAWLNDPQFKNFVNVLSEQNLNNIGPTAITEFTKLINEGDWKAIRFYLETTGAAKPTNAPSGDNFIQSLIEIIQKHVKDPRIIAAIAKDMELASSNKRNELVVEAEYTTESPEFIEAQKMIGY
jgi:hypothetical protein